MLYYWRSNLKYFCALCHRWPQHSFALSFFQTCKGYISKDIISWIYILFEDIWYDIRSFFCGGYMIWYQIQKLLGYDIYGTYPFCPVFVCHFLKNSDIEAFFEKIKIRFGSNFRCIINFFSVGGEISLRVSYRVFVCNSINFSWGSLPYWYTY